MTHLVGLDDCKKYDPIDILPCLNGLLHVPTRTLLPPTPLFFALNGANVHYDPKAPDPANWLMFLLQLWPADIESINALAELMGYFLIPQTGLQKIGMIVGPRRAGKGTIARVIKRLCGERNCCSPTLDNLGEQFGREHLIGKSVAVIADARISGRTDTAAVCERLLSISGEDHQSIPRKFKSAWQGQLRTRFLVLTNSLPRIEDESGAFSSRFVILRLTHSWLGRENPKLFDSFSGEYAGILNWALDGRDRLYKNGHFTSPQASGELIDEFEKLSSPVTAFVEDRCELGTQYMEPCDDVYGSWRDWCYVNGRKNIGTVQSFGAALHAAYPELRVTRPRSHGGPRKRVWNGLRLKEPVGMAATGSAPRSASWSAHEATEEREE